MKKKQPGQKKVHSAQLVDCKHRENFQFSLRNATIAPAGFE